MTSQKLAGRQGIRRTLKEIFKIVLKFNFENIVICRNRIEMWGVPVFEIPIHRYEKYG